MNRRIIVLDLVLVVLLGFGVAKLRRDWFAFDPAHQVSAIQPLPEKFPALPSSAGNAAPGVVDWTEIPTHNPFSFDRNDIAILAPAEPPAPPKPSGPRPILFGTFNLGTGWSAMLASGTPNNRSSRPMKVGEGLDGWTIVEIQDKSVVIEANSQRETVNMDSVTQVQRDYGRTLASAAAPAAPAPLQVNPPASSTPNTAPAAKRTKTIYTPFGPKVVEEDQ